MKNRLFSITTLLVALAATPKIQAEVGGPFDNGEFNKALTSSGIYQVTFSFPNGSGMASWSEGNAFGASASAGAAGGGSGASASASSNTFTANNRSLFYYKGITYFGTATGVADIQAKQITGFTNGSSDLSSTASAGASSIFTAGGVTSTASIGANAGVGFTANSHYTAKITSDHPTIRFKGNGEVSFMGPQQLEALHDAIGDTTSGIFGAEFTGQLTTLPFGVTGITTTFTEATTVTSTVTNVGPPPTTNIITTFTPPVMTVVNTLAPVADSAFAHRLLSDLQSLYAQVDNPSALTANMERQKMKVYGSRRYL
jgi:hypothetical protein